MKDELLERDLAECESAREISVALLAASIRAMMITQTAIREEYSLDLVLRIMAVHLPDTQESLGFMTRGLFRKE